MGLASLPSSNDELRKAFRVKAKEKHPDRGGDPDDFQQLVADFDMLSALVDGSQTLPEAYVRVTSQKGDQLTCTVHHLCQQCHGMVKKVTCPTCYGRPQECPRCRGLRVITDVCFQCGGTKLTTSEVTLSAAELNKGKIKINGMICLVKVIESD